MGSYSGWYVYMKDEATNHVQHKLISWPSRKRVLLMKIRFIGILMSAWWKVMDKRYAPKARHFETCRLQYEHVLNPMNRNIIRTKSYDSLLDNAKWGNKLNAFDRYKLLELT